MLLSLHTGGHPGPPLLGTAGKICLIRIPGSLVGTHTGHILEPVACQKVIHLLTAQNPVDSEPE